MIHTLKPYFRPEATLGLGLTTLWVLATLYLPNGLVRSSFSVAFLLLVPGYFLYRLLLGSSKPASPAHSVTYSAGLSVVLLMLTGLLVNTTFRIMDIPHPLATAPLTLAAGGVTAVLALASTFIKKPAPWRLKFNLKQAFKGRKLILLTGLVLPFLAIGGANTLNNGGTNWLALTTLSLVGLYFLVLAWKKEQPSTVYAFALFCITLATLLGTSLRGWNITGHDIMQEYQVFQLTLQHLTWNMNYYQDAYNACLSITILPTMLQQLTGITSPYIFKFVFQLLFALIAPTMYITLSRYIPRKMALLSTFVFIAFPTFLTDIPMLNRQEVAFLSLALALQAAMDQTLSYMRRHILSFIFIVGMILSHYSTSYIAVTILALMLLLTFGLRFHPKSRKLSRLDASPKLFTIPAVVAAILLLVGWNGLATHTAGNIVKTVDSVAANLSKFAHGQQLTDTVAKNTNLTPYQQYTTQTTAHLPLPPNNYYPDAQQSTYQVAQKTEAIAPETSLATALRIPSSLLSLTYNVSRQAYAALIQAFIVLGLLLLTIITYRRSTKLPAQYTLLGISLLLVIGAEVLFPPLLVNYGLLRLILEGLIVLALPVVIASYWLLRKLRLPEIWRPRVVALSLVCFFFIMAGVFPAITGGFKPALALSNSGFYYEAYYTHNSEISATQWLLRDTPVGSRVYADEFARRKVITYSDSTIFPQPVLIPEAIPVDSYVYLSQGNTAYNDVPFYYKGELLFHTVPYNFLATHKNLIYSSGSVEIYK